MKSKKNLVFLGMMGSGKSSIGSLIAKKLQLNFIDIDNVIEKELGLSIKKIFETKGENYFRKFEEKTTLKKLKSSSTVISLGGGAFSNKEIRKERKTFLERKKEKKEGFLTKHSVSFCSLSCWPVLCSSVTSDLQTSRVLRKSRVKERHNRGTKRQLTSRRAPRRPKKGAKRFSRPWCDFNFRFVRRLCHIVPLCDATSATH